MSSDFENASQRHPLKAFVNGMAEEIHSITNRQTVRFSLEDESSAKSVRH
jgi:hypothetical protein